MKREPKKKRRKRCVVPRPWIVSSLMRTSPSWLTFIVAEKYDITAWRDGALTGMKRRKSL
jgi:hypothetical protein